jgi:hypothetical protein
VIGLVNLLIVIPLDAQLWRSWTLTCAFYPWITASKDRPRSCAPLGTPWSGPTPFNAGLKANGLVMCQIVKQLRVLHPYRLSMAGWWTTDTTWSETQCSTSATRDLFWSESPSYVAQNRVSGRMPHHFVSSNHTYIIIPYLFISILGRNGLFRNLNYY